MHDCYYERDAGISNFEERELLYRYDALNLLSYMTQNAKNILCVVHHKDELVMVLDYPSNFGNAAKRGLMRTTHWAA